MLTQADLVIHNARVRTGDPARPLADWVAVSGDKILAVGTADQPPAAKRRIDAAGGTLTPGLNDAHLHLFAGGLSLKDLSLEGVSGMAALRVAVTNYRAQHPDIGFLSAHSADYHILPKGLDRMALDDICPDIPLLVMAVDYHTAWANTVALQMAGILRGAVLTPGNMVVLDQSGTATGTLQEFEAIDLVRRINPAMARHSAAAQHPLLCPDVSAKDRAADMDTLWAALRHCAEQGLTAVQNMDGSLYQLELLAQIDATHGLPLRVRMPFPIGQGCRPDDLSHAVQWRDRYQSPLLRCDFVKIFADGVIDSGTAHLLADYSHTPGQRGMALFSDAALTDLISRADHLGFQIAVHAVGDGAVRQVLNAFATLTPGRRHRIEHIEMIDPADIPRFAELGVIASMQPTHVPDGGEGYLDLIGPDRGRYAFALADLRAAGAEFVFGTDWPIAPLSPLITVQAAMNRPLWPDGVDHRVDLTTALFGITEAAARVACDPDRGRIMPGMAADLTLFDADLVQTGAQAVVVLTLCNGTVTYDRTVNEHAA